MIKFRKESSASVISAYKISFCFFVFLVPLWAVHVDEELHEDRVMLGPGMRMRAPATTKRLLGQIVPGNTNKNCVASNTECCRSQAVLFSLENSSSRSAQLASGKPVWCSTEQEPEGKSDKNHLLRESLMKEHAPGFSSTNIS